jgi:hypothetical protein
MSTLSRRAWLFSFVVVSAIALAAASGCASLPWVKANAGPSGPATVTGKVTSDRGAVLANASVVLHGPSVRRQTTTDIAGRFVIANVPLGQFTLSASAPGYKSAKHKVQVDKEGEVQADIQLKY